MNRTRSRDTTLPRLARTRWARILIPALLLVAFATEFLTREGPDYSLHSWVGIALMPAVAVHLTGNAGWIKRVWRRKRQDRDFGLGLLNAAFGALTGVCIATGFPIWLDWSDAAGWTALHTGTGFGSILVMLIHLWRNRTRLSRLVRR